MSKIAWKKSLFAILLATMIMTMFTNRVQAVSLPNDYWSHHASSSFAGGDGTKEKPFQISTPEQFSYMATIFNNLNTLKSYKDKHYQLTNDIDLSKYLWNPIGASNSHSGKKAYFQGYFDGKKHTVSGLYIKDESKPAYAGLFGYIKSPANNKIPVIKDLKIKDAYLAIKPKGSVHIESFAGILAGYVKLNDSIIQNVDILGEVHRVDSAYDLIATGGMIGYAENVTIENCTSDIKITGESSNGSDYKGDYAGGFLGMAIDCTIENSSSKGSIQGAKQIGGFVVNARESKIKKCESYVNIDATNQYVGGFVGMATETTIDKCAAYGTIKNSVQEDNTKTGGFIGNNSVNSILSDCFFAGKITGKSGVGSFVGNAIYGEMKSCHFDKENNSLGAIGYNKTTHTNDIQATSHKETLDLICKNIGHDYSEWLSESEADCTQEGVHTRQCSRCQHIDRKTSLGDHTVVKVDGKKATMTEAGNIEYWYCEKCHKYFQDKALTKEITKEETIIPIGKTEVPPAGNRPENSDNANTEDNANIGYYVIFILVSGVAIYIFKKNKRVRIYK